ncbi:hypothetical protein Q8F60_00865 [Streptococcus constellatus]|uniref:Uncharacterized protein n=1 Tax=Streptococcus constellatus subsp. constellatus SK53 TaxID=1095730 RepID=A0AAD2SWL3_STRCV|nr:hypothetical protein [Streptococcus constellatus]EID22331.1 hypothetical protein HMPREF1044_0169 [Streptococcus constellatus subsp. constellatus SK53]MDP1484631.1 hypothetical protein [Streptococcus constellatus]QQT05961.1 hypothetical protein I6J13_02210 [Streptococcus constellatus]SUN40534.1 Uncharacterised protein [Streptococcus constellatus]BBD22608.1 hypothetical protein SCSC_0934 [Streptococcus constellatus subsp. constellatus]
MARQNYFEILNQMEFDPDRESKNLIDLLEMEKNFGHVYYTTINSAISKNFLDYPNRSTFTSYSQIIEVISANFYDATEELFVFSELLVDIFYSLLEKFTTEECEFIQVIFDNINRFLELSNHELITLDNGNRIIVEKNVYASEVSQIVSETSIQDAIKVLEYNHFANKGNIERKKEILISLATYLEPFRDELNDSEELKEVMKVNNNKKIIAVEQLFNMYNNLGLRHNNSKQYHLEITEEELEQWYDDIYASTLFVILSLDEARILSKLKTLRNG